MNAIIEWFNSPMKRLWKLTWLAVAYLLLALLLISFIPALASSVLFYPVVILYGFTVARVTRATGGMTRQPDEALDERQRALRNKAYRLSYQLISWLGLLLAIPPVLIRASTQGLPSFLSMQEPLQIAQVMVGIIFTYVLLQHILPVTMIAWLEPDPIDDDVDGEFQRQAT